MTFLDNLFDKEAVDKFYKKHSEKCGNYTDYDFICYGTGIGIRVMMKCEDCLAAKDVSDYEHW
jgi:hypothetical protein